MSYVGHRHGVPPMTMHFYLRGRGLGQSPSSPPLRSFDELPKEGERFNITWALLSDAPTIQALRNRLIELRALNPGEADDSLSETGALVTGLKNFWLRASSDPDLWPGVHAHQNFNFGPTNMQNGVGQIRINRGMWDLLNGADVHRPWRETDRGFVRLRVSDPVMTAMRNKLYNLGYIDAAVMPSVQENSEFVRALMTYAYELGAIGVDAGSWPSGFNFGPNDGDKLRVSSQLLNSLINTQDNPRSVAAVEGFTSGIATMRTKPPLIGSVGTGSPSALLLTPAPVLRRAAISSIAPRPGLVAAMTKVR